MNPLHELQTALGDRKAEAERIMRKYPDRVPVVCLKAKGSDLPNMTKNKFLVPDNMLIGEFKYIVYKHLRLDAQFHPDQTIYLFSGTSALRTGTLMSEAHERHRDEDDFLYITYAAENTLGATAVASRVSHISGPPFMPVTNLADGRPSAS